MPCSSKMFGGNMRLIRNFSGLKLRKSSLFCWRKNNFYLFLVKKINKMSSIETKKSFQVYSSPESYLQTWNYRLVITCQTFERKSIYIFSRDPLCSLFRYHFFLLPAKRNFFFFWKEVILSEQVANPAVTWVNWAINRWYILQLGQ